MSLLPARFRATFLDVTRAPNSARRIAIVAFPDVQTLDLVGPLEVFDAAQRVQAARRPGEAAYTIEVVAETLEPLRSSSGLYVLPQRTLKAVRGPLDTLMVAGGFGSRAASRSTALVPWVRRQALRARRVASVCTGAFVLGAAGLLEGRRATTHWASCKELAKAYPHAKVETDPIFVRDGKLWTSAGVTAGMDLALALVEADLGRDVALSVARYLVMFVRRPGGQSQFSAQLASQLAEHAPLRELQGYIADHLTEDLSVPRLAARAAMSPRHFARAFRAEVGTTPAVYVENLRLEVARRLLETTSFDLEAVADGSGFGTVETLRRVFARQLHVAPKDYRRRFQPKRERP
jgi:transcriptional regulator GlxA family with amidase domain